MGHISRIGLRSILSVLAVGFVGCTPEQSSNAPEQRALDSEEATAVTTERVEQMLTGLSEATEQLDTTDSTTVATDGLNAAVGSNRCGQSTSNTLTSGSTKAVDSIPDETTNKLSELLVRIRDEAVEHVFRDELVETKDGKQVIYKMDPAQVCKENAECFDKLTENPLRFAVTANTDDTLNVALLVGQDRHSPATAVLSDTKIAVRGNLTEFMDSIRLFMSAEDQKDLPDKLAGVVEWSIEKRGEGDFVFTTSILERLDLAVGQAKGKPISVTVQPSNPTSQVTINSVTNTIGFKENIGTIDVSAAGSAVCGDLDCGQKEESGTFGLHLAGFTGAFTTTANATDITFSGLGLGQESSYLAINGQHLVTADVNPTQGRKFSMNFKKTTEGTLVTFEPALDLQIAIAMTNLSESMRVDMPDWLFDEVFDVTLGGAPKPSILIPAATCDANGDPIIKDQAKVVSGNLTLGATSLPSPVEVSTNMCLLPVEGSEENAHPFSLLTSGVCQ